MIDLNINAVNIIPSNIDLSKPTSTTSTKYDEFGAPVYAPASVTESIPLTGNSGSVDPLSVAKSALNGQTNLGVPQAIAPGTPSVTADPPADVAKFQKSTQTATGANAGSPIMFDENGKLPNVLHQYSSYNYIFTLSVLDDNAVNFPDETYKVGDFGKIILRSASGSPENRIETAYGKFDFFLDDLNIEHIIGFNKKTGNTNAINLNFKITEPYSMGLFFQALQIAAAESGHKNYMDIPLLLTIEFIGHKDPENLGIHADKLTQDTITKHYPFRLYDIGMKTTASGTTYEVSGYPYNDKAFSREIMTLKTDVSVYGGTVHELLQTGEKSLQKVINDWLKDQALEDQKDPDEILILFPENVESIATQTSKESSSTYTKDTSKNEPPGNTINAKLEVSIGSNSTRVQSVGKINAIGRADMGFNLYNGTTPRFAKDIEAFASGVFVRGKITLNPTKGELKFAQGTDIVNAINQVIMISDYPNTVLTDAKVNKTGKVEWWRVEPKVYNISTDVNYKKTGEKPKLYVYRVVKYYVSTSVFNPVNAPMSNFESAKRAALKEYNYIYTAKNLDITDFNFEIKAGFFKGLQSDISKRTTFDFYGSTSAQGQEQKPLEGDKNKEGREPIGEELPVQNKDTRIFSSTRGYGSGIAESHKTVVARQFHDIVTTGVDMVNLNVSIHGDPYYLGDSGVGNYTALPTDKENVNSDGAMNYENGEVDIVINFRTPIDIDTEKGAYNFMGIDTQKDRIINEFSGIFKVLKVDSNFSRGLFTQKLDLIRRIGQFGTETKQSMVRPVDNQVPEGDDW